MACAICEIRRPRRFCPGVRGDICSTCCGTEREVTVSCPLECEYLQEARLHEKTPPVNQKDLPNLDIRIKESFVEERQDLLAFLSSVLLRVALETPGTVDFDVREALEALIRTHRTLQSGVYYETVPPNPLAANIFRAVQGAVAEFRNREQQRLGISHTRDADILGLLVFLQRIEFNRNNGRQRGRAFLDSVRTLYAEAAAPADAPPSSLILP